MEISSLSFFLYFSITCLLILFWWTLRWRKYKSPPMFPGALPILGHSLIALSYDNDYWGFVKNVMEYTLSNGEDLSTVVLGKYTVYFLANPDDCYKVANACIMKHDGYKFVKPWLGEGLLSSTVSIWKRHRKLLNPAFSQHILDGYLDVFNNESRNLVNVFKEQCGKAPFDHLPYVENWALTNICSTAMGFRDEDNRSDIFKEYSTFLLVLTEYLMQRIQKIWLHSDYIFEWSSLKSRQDKALGRLNMLSDKIIHIKTIAMQNTVNDSSDTGRIKSKSYLEFLLDLNMRNLLTNKEVKEESATIIATGYDTSFIVLSQILIVLGSHLDVQDKVYLELQDIFGEEDRDVTKKDLSHMKYLEAVIKESLRLYPVGPVVFRHIDKDVQIKNYTLPAGSDFAIPIYALNRHPVWGPDAKVFRPERWLDPSNLPDKHYANASFCIGRRNCIGMNYAIMVLKTSLTHILRSYKVTADINKVKYRLLITLSPMSGHHIKLEKR